MHPLLSAFVLSIVASSPEPVRDAEGIRVHTLVCPFQEGSTEVRVLLPDKLPPLSSSRVVYVLPVEPRREHRYGDGLEEIRRRGLHNQYDAIFVSPTFARTPWYADHPSRPDLRQETYFLQVVLPLVERSYPVLREPSGRLLLGFSKSGWGAFTLLLRHPQTFGRAAAWDSPWMLQRPDRFGTAEIFATQENFDRYRITRLLEDRAREISLDRRLILMGYGNFLRDTQKAHALLLQLGISHEYRDGPQRSHDWHSGWLPEALQLLLHPQD